MEFIKYLVMTVLRLAHEDAVEPQNNDKSHQLLKDGFHYSMT